MRFNFRFTCFFVHPLSTFYMVKPSVKSILLCFAVILTLWVVAREWRYMGKIGAVSSMTRTGMYHGEEGDREESEPDFLYARSDGDKGICKIYVPETACSYTVSRNYDYDGISFKRSGNGKRIEKIPSMSSMFTHPAGPYYFNVSSVTQ